MILSAIPLIAERDKVRHEYGTFLRTRQPNQKGQSEAPCPCCRFPALPYYGTSSSALTRPDCSVHHAKLTAYGTAVPAAVLTEYAAPVLAAVSPALAAQAAMVNIKTKAIKSAINVFIDFIDFMISSSIAIS
jgi:hypothetical protein